MRKERPKRHRPDSRALLILLITLGAFGGCEPTPDSQDDATSSNTDQTTTVNTVPRRTDPIALDCAAAGSGLDVPEGNTTRANGLISSLFRGRPDLTSLPTMSTGERDYVAVKSLLYVTPEAAERTTLRLLTPSSVRLYYTSWARWSDGQNDAEVLRTARSTVTVPSCGDATVGYPGLLLIDEPSCVRLHVSGNEQFASQVRTLAMGRRDC